MFAEFPTFEAFSAQRKEPVRYQAFKEHCQPLEIQAKGKTLIIGPSIHLFELALIEPQVKDGSITEIITIGELPVMLKPSLYVYESYHPQLPISLSRESYHYFFEGNPSLMFDTILFICIPLSHPEDTIQTLALHLNSQGNLYLTDNAFRQPIITPIDGLTVRVMEKPLPEHPDYNGPGNYYGIITTKH